MIKKTPFNYSNDMDRRRQGLDNIVENLLPDVSTNDAGKIIKVSEAGKWTLGDVENTIIEANPEEQPTIDLENLKIGSTVYSVKNPELTSIKSFKLTMSNGGQYNTNKPIIEFYDVAGVKASITSSDYTVECDKTYAGNANMDQVCSIETPNTPGTFTYTFVNDFDIDTYKLIKLTRGGTFLNDIAKNIKLELSADGENYLTIYDETTITWSDAVPYHLISLKDGSEASTILPIVTSNDNGKVLGVVNGNWDKMNVPTELPVVTSADYEKILQVDSTGNWIAVNDYYHIGDNYHIVSNTLIPCVIQNVAQKSFSLVFTLPKNIDSNITGIHFNDNAKVWITDNKGTQQVAFNTKITDCIDFSTPYISADGIQFIGSFKTGYGDFTNLTDNDFLMVMVLNWTITFD